MCPPPLLEICLLTDDRRVATVKASTTVDLFSLSKEQFQAILEEYPEMKQTMSTVAVERLHKIGLNAPRKLSAQVSELFAEPVDEYQKEHDFPPAHHEGMAAEALEGHPLRRRQVSFASEDEVLDLRRWSDCHHYDRLQQTKQLGTPTKRRKLSLLSTGGKRTAHKLDPVADNNLGRIGESTERFSLTPITEVESSPKDPSTTTAGLARSTSSPLPLPTHTCTTAARRSTTKVHPLPLVSEGKKNLS